MTRTISSLVLGLGVLGSLFASTANADLYPQTACNDRGYSNGRTGYLGGYGNYGSGYGYRDDFRHDHQYGSAYGSGYGYGAGSIYGMAGRNWDNGRYASHDYGWSNSYRPYDNYGYSNSRWNDGRGYGIRYDRMNNSGYRY